MQFLNEDKPDECARWFACLELGFKAAQDRTILKHRWHLDQLGCKKCYGQKKLECVMPLLCIRLQELPGAII